MNFFQFHFFQMIPRVLCSARCLVLVTIILIVTCISEALPIPWNLEGNNLVRQNYSPVPVPSPFDGNAICANNILDPALSCGCYAYKKYFMSDPEWEGLKDLCIEQVNGDFEYGYTQCAARFREGGVAQIDEDLLNDFFDEASKFCAYESHSSLPAHYLQNSRRNPIMDKFRLETFMPEFALNSEGSIAARLPTATFVHPKMASMCVLLAHRNRYPRNKAYRICCPGFQGR